MEIWNDPHMNFNLLPQRTKKCPQRKKIPQNLTPSHKLKLVSCLQLLSTTLWWIIQLGPITRPGGRWTGLVYSPFQKPGGCFTNVSRALQNNLAKIHNTRNHIYDQNFKLKLCTCAQSMALGTRTKFQLEILITSTNSAIHQFRENILESSRNVSETTPWNLTEHTCVEDRQACWNKVNHGPVDKQACWNQVKHGPVSNTDHWFWLLTQIITTQLPGRVDSRFAPRQWETSLQSNTVSYWLCANLESALPCTQYIITP